MFKIGVHTGRGFLGALMAMAGGLAHFSQMIGPSAPIAGSSFRKRSNRTRYRKYSGDHPTNDTGWWRQRADIRPMVITERMLLRHGWYRRKLRKEGIAIDPNAKNAVRL